jgi:hypothetical protein
MSKLTFTVEAETPQELMTYVKAMDLSIALDYIANEIRTETKYGEMSQESLTRLVERIRNYVYDALNGID